MKEISKYVRYIGVLDKGIDLFESQYLVPDGVSYNSYVILDEEVAVMDTVDSRKTEEWLVNLERELDGRVPNYLVIHHMEPDHAASVQVLAEKYPDLKVVGNTKIFNMIRQFFTFDLTDRMELVEEGDELCLGETILSFYMAPMVHWPEVMVSYLAPEKLLFSADGFGTFGPIDQTGDWSKEARRYYFNIAGKYGPQVLALLKKAATLDIEKICPLHGPILDENLAYYLEKYNTWGNYIPEESGVVIAHASIHGHTRDAALKLAELFREAGEENVVVFDLDRDQVSVAIAEAFRYDRLVLASATYNMDIFPPMRTFVHLLKAKNFQKRKVAVIENGTWVPAAGKLIKEYLEGMKDVVISEASFTITSALKEEEIPKLQAIVEDFR
ncbi:FprA family A-type flavoprotein [Clostridia bacterium]|nr:FprA family A-type flavoprotein [Clostridia bacterium]